MNIHPFAAVRPNPGDAALVASVPYDVVDTAEAKALAAGNPKSFLHVSRPEIDLPDGTDCSSPEAYAQAKKALDALVADGTTVTTLPNSKIALYDDAVVGKVVVHAVHGVDGKRVLDEAGLLVGPLGIHAQQVDEELAERAVAPPDVAGIGHALRREHHAPVALLLHHAVLLEVRERLGHARLGDLEVLGNVDRAHAHLGVDAALGHDAIDRFEIVLACHGEAVLPVGVCTSHGASDFL